MSVKKVREGVFDIYIRMGRADRIRKRVKCASQLDALAIETEMRRELGKEARTLFTVSSVSEKYIPWMELHQRPKTVIDKRRMLMSQILPFFGAMFPDRITAQAIDIQGETASAWAQDQPASKSGTPLSVVHVEMGIQSRVMQ